MFRKKSSSTRRSWHFRAEARRNKLLGLWAAKKLGKTDAEAQAYADELVVAETATNASDVVVARVLKDFAAAGVDQSEHQIRRTMDELLSHRATPRSSRARNCRVHWPLQRARAFVYALA